MDDVANVVDNPQVHSPTFESIFLRPHEDDYMPMTISIFALAHKLFGLDPGAFHLLNLCLHLVGGIFLFLYLGALTPQYAWFPTLIFLIHPMQVESVAWITELKNTMSGALYFGFLYLYARSPSSKFFLTLLFFLGLLSKATMAFVPFAVLATDLALGRNLKENLVFKVGLVIGGIGFFVFRASLFDFASADGLAFVSTLNQSVKAFVFYLSRLTFPRDLGVFYERGQVEILLVDYLIAISTVLSWVWIAKKRKTKELVFGLLILLPTLLIVLPLGRTGVRYDFADRYVYLAIAGWAYLWSLLINRYVLLAYGVGLLVLTFSQVGIWKNDSTLWANTLNTYPLNTTAYFNLGASEERKGNFTSALERYKRAIEIDPNYSAPFVNYGAIKARLGEFQEARAALEKAVQLQPNVAVAQNNLGFVLMKLGEKDSARIHFERAIELSPHFELPKENLKLLSGQ